MPKVDDTPEGLRCYQFHGLDLDIKGNEAIGDCPFCDKERKFSVNIETGKCRCFSCEIGSFKGGTNPYGFIQRLWEYAVVDVEGLEEIREDRDLLYTSTLEKWGLRKCHTSGYWILPGYNSEGKINQLYRWSDFYIKGQYTKRMIPTPGLDPTSDGGDTERMGLMGRGEELWNPDNQDIYLCEGCWDAMTLWEVLGACKKDGNGELHPTSKFSDSLLSTSCVLATPSCNIFPDSWHEVFRGKNLYLLFDNDHSKKHPRTGTEIGLGGYRGMKRVFQILSSLQPSHRPVQVYYLNWGEEGYNPDFPTGFDIRDILTLGHHRMGDRVLALGTLLSMLEPCPEAWNTEEGRAVAKNAFTELTSMSCHNWQDLLPQWNNALRWRQDLEDTLAVMLAVALSTDQVGDSQLFLQVIGDPGSAKTKICDAMLVSRKCHLLEHLTGFHSGWKGKDDSEDFSLIARINHKTLITPEGDVLMKNPRFHEIMSQQRRIFDGSSSASYKNRKEDTKYEGLRTPWIIAGTPALMASDQSQLGDRFLRIWIDPPTEEDKQNIMRMVGFTALRSVLQTCNGAAETTMDKHLARAYRMTGGYVDYLRSNVDRLFKEAERGIGNDDEKLVQRCAVLADFVAYMRARPDSDWMKGRGSLDKDASTTKEQPTRLIHQFVRLSACLMAVMNKEKLDSELDRIVTKVATDTSRGIILDSVRILRKEGRKGCYAKTLSLWTSQPPETTMKLLMFMRRIGVVESYSIPGQGGKKAQPRFRLTDKVSVLYDTVMDQTTFDR